MLELLQDPDRVITQAEEDFVGIVDNIPGIGPELAVVHTSLSMAAYAEGLPGIDVRSLERTARQVALVLSRDESRMQEVRERILAKRKEWDEELTILLSRIATSLEVDSDREEK